MESPSNHEINIAKVYHSCPHGAEVITQSISVLGVTTPLDFALVCVERVSGLI